MSHKVHCAVYDPVPGPCDCRGLRTTMTAAEALRQLLAAAKQITADECKDLGVWNTLGGAIGVAEMVLRDGEKQEPVAWALYAANGNVRIWWLNYEQACGWARNNDIDQREIVPLYAAPQPASVSAAPSGEVERDAKHWRTFTRVLRTGHIPSAAHGRRFKIIETCAMSGDENEFNDFIGAIEALATKE